MKIKYSGTIPFINLKFKCDWVGNVDDYNDSFTPTFKHPIIIEFEGCDSRLKLWEKENKWFIRVINKRRRKHGRTS
jgi:hypothetical protein